MLNSSETRCWTVEDFYASIVNTFLKTWKVGIWSMKMVLIACVNTVNCWICLKKFKVIYNEVNSWEYIFTRGKICSFLNRLLHEFLGLAPAIILAVIRMSSRCAVSFRFSDRNCECISNLPLRATCSAQLILLITNRPLQKKETFGKLHSKKI
jgi:hypothetical protein